MGITIEHKASNRYSYGVETSDWSVHPVIYKGQKYFVDIRVYRRFSDDKIMVSTFIQEYLDEKKLFRGHRGKDVFNADVASFDLNGTVYDAKNIPDELFLSRAPEFVQAIFKSYLAELKKEEETNEQITIASKWDGDIEKVSTHKPKLDYDKQLTDEQYDTEEYQIGFANGVCNVLGLMQRKRDLGCTLEEVIEETFRQHNDIFQIEDLK